MAWTSRGIWAGDGRNPEIDCILPGLQRGTGRDRDRFRASSGTKDRHVFDRREHMIRDLHARLLFDVLRAVVDREVSVAKVEEAYRQGETALVELSKQAKAKRLSHLVGLYMATLADTKLEHAEDHLSRLLVALGPTADTADLTATALNQFLGSLTWARKPKSRQKEPPRASAAATKNRYRASIQGFCSWLVREGHMPTSPFYVAKAVTAYDESSGTGRLPELEADELQAYLTAVEASDGPAYRLLLWAHIETGADSGELHDALTVRCVRFPTDPSGLTRLRFIRTKTEGRGAVERSVPITKGFAAALAEHITRWQLGRDDLVFHMTDYHRAYKVHTAAMGRARKVAINRKDLRHVAAIRWRRAGADLEQIREWLGHTSIEQTRIYAAFKPNDDFDAPVVDRLAKQYTQEGV